MSYKITNLSFNIAWKHSRPVRHNTCSENLLKIDKNNPVMKLISPNITIKVDEDPLDKHLKQYNIKGST